MSQCQQCGSYAINPHLYGRGANADLDLCDVCYWRKRAEAAQSSPETEALRAERDTLREAMKGATVIAQHAGTEINSLRAKTQELKNTMQQLLDALDAEDRAEKAYQKARERFQDAIAEEKWHRLARAQRTSATQAARAAARKA